MQNTTVIHNSKLHSRCVVPVQPSREKIAISPWMTGLAGNGLWLLFCLFFVLHIAQIWVWAYEFSLSILPAIYQ
jgi:hypothetical protein